MRMSQKMSLLSSQAEEKVLRLFLYFFLFVFNERYIHLGRTIIMQKHKKVLIKIDIIKLFEHLNYLYYRMHFYKLYVFKLLYNFLISFNKNSFLVNCTKNAIFCAYIKEILQQRHKLFKRILPLAESPPIYHDWLRSLNYAEGQLFELHRRKGGMKDIGYIS